MILLSIEIGSIAEWLSAFAGVLAAALSVAALKTARDANRTAERMREEARQGSIDSIKLQKEQDARDLERERRAMASTLQAWWVADQGEGSTRWGILISNEGSLASVFRNVDISASGNANADRVHIKSLPPGRFFIESAGSSGSAAWKLPESASDASRYTPITQSERHKIRSIQFTDPVGCRWRWREEDGVQRMEQAV